MSKPEIFVVVGILFREGRVLLTRRPEGVHVGGYWEFPGGKRDPGETEAEACARELREELGVEVAVDSCLHRERFDYPERVVELAFYRCRLVIGEPRPLSATDLRWCLPTEIEPDDMPPANLAILKRLTGGEISGPYRASGNESLQ